MTKTLEKTGKTVDLAVEAALAELGIERDDVSVEILERPRSGFLGIGAVPAKVLVSYEAPDEPKAKPVAPKAAATESAAKPAAAKPAAPAAEKPARKQEKKAASVPAEPVKAEKETTEKPEQKAKKPADPAAEEAAIRSFLTGLFERMDIEAEIEISRRDNNGVDVRLSGDSMGAVIGRRGETLDAIQHLTNYVVNRGCDKRMHISIDAEAYRAKREESLERLAEKMAEKALKYKRSMALEPMNSYERHVIHTALQNYEGVTTASTGEEPNRRVVVTPVKTGNEPAAPAKPRTREWA